jgi:putative sterol carrier protein
MAKFPTPEWVQALKDKLNHDAHYAQVARNWEGDIRFVVEQCKTFVAPDGSADTLWLYIDLWHGKCNGAYIETELLDRKPAFVLKATYGNAIKILEGKLDAMQALMTRKLGVQGNLAVLMRNVPTVLDFVRCCREVTDSVM